MKRVGKVWTDSLTSVFFYWRIAQVVPCPALYLSVSFCVPLFCQCLIEHSFHVNSVKEIIHEELRVWLQRVTFFVSIVWPVSWKLTFFHMMITVETISATYFKRFSFMARKMEDKLRQVHNLDRRVDDKVNE